MAVATGGGEKLVKWDQARWRKVSSSEACSCNNLDFREGFSLQVLLSPAEQCVFNFDSSPSSVSLVHHPFSLGSVARMLLLIFCVFCLVASFLSYLIYPTRLNFFPSPESDSLGKNKQIRVKLQGHMPI